ncbi:MAG TPA: ABC transporter ATP-binding protein [Thermodesulfobacteriota bacterium]
MTAPAKLLIDGVSMRFRTKRGDTIEALAGISFAVRPRELAVIVGTSGCGKSTLLRIAAGLVAPTAGRVVVDGREVVGPGADRGMVPQAYTPFHWLTVQGNVEFGPRLRGVPAAERRALANRYLEMVGLSGFAGAYPKELSGGMLQRVALARALANDPEILLMDEPFGALDAQTRSEMQEMLLKVTEAAGQTVLFVTHDIDEAIYLGDRVFVMTSRPGRLRETVEVGVPRPRPLEFTATPEFAALKRRVLDLVRRET